MTAAVTKMAESLGSKPNTSALERLPVPVWDGNRRMYRIWKREFNHSMSKYGQDPDEQLQRFRKAMPKGYWWTEQVKTCKTIVQAWSILDVEFHMREVKRRERDEEECNGYATLPYVHGVTERVKRVLEGHGIKTSVTP